MHQTPIYHGPLMHFDSGIRDITNYSRLCLHFKGLGYGNRPYDSPIDYKVRHSHGPFYSSVLTNNQG